MDRPSAAQPGEPAPEQESPAGGTGNKRLRIVTRCSTLEEFFVTFGGFADETSLFIVTNKPRALGLVQPFVIQLKDGTSIMRGEVEVIQSTTTGEGPEGRNGMRLKFLQADDGTREVLRHLLEYAQAKRSIAPPPGEPVAAAPTMRPAAPSETTAVSAPPGAGPPRPPPRPEPPPAPPGPASTTQISVQTDPPSPGARSAPVPVAVVARAGSEPTLAERAPGAAYQLPANPFEGITAEALESFIECTLYEERVPKPDEPPIETSVIFALPGAPGSVYPPAAPAGVLPAGMVPPPPPAAGLVPQAPPTFSAAGPAAPPTFGLAPPGAPGPSPGTPPPAVVRDAVLLAAAIQAASVPATQTRRWWLIGATAVVSSIASLVGAYLLWGRTPDAPEVTTSIPSAPPASAPTPPERTGAPAPTPAPSAGAAPTSTLPRECRAHIRSYPNGASVLWNNEPLGTTPLVEAPVPCGPARVTFQMPGYESGERSANAIVYKSAGVFLRLSPVRVPVDVTSTPPGADILVNGRPMGRTPATITLVGPSASTLLIRTAGYKPHKREVLPEPPRMTVNVDLDKK